MATETINVQNARQAALVMQSVVNETMARLADFDPSEVLQTIVLRRLRIWHTGYFTRDVSPMGEPWPALAAFTVWKKGHSRILEETEALLRSLIGKNKFTIAHVRKEQDQTVLTYGTSRPDAWRHQVGQGRPGQNLPRRTFLGVDGPKTDQIAGFIADAAVRHLKRPTAASGLRRRSA